MAEPCSRFRSGVIFFSVTSIAVALLSIRSGSNPARAEDTPLRTVYLHDTKDSLYKRFTEPCVRTLKSNLEARGLKVIIGGDANDASEAFLDIGIFEPTDDLALDVSEARAFALTKNVFRDPTHFARYLESDDARPKVASDSFLILPGTSRWLGSAYAATSQVFTGDKTAIEPAILNRRAIIYSDVSLGSAIYTADFDFHYTFIFDKVSADDASYKATLEKYLQKVGPERVFIVQPLAVGLIAIPPKFRTYVSLVNWHVITVYFSGGANEPPDHIAVLGQAVRTAAASCSDENFKNELKVRQALEGAGSNFVPVNLDAYQALKLRHFQERLAEAQKQLAAGEGSRESVQQAQFELDTYNKIQRLR